MQVKRKQYRWRVSLPRIIRFGPMIRMMSFKNISWRSGENGIDNSSGYFIYIFVVLLENNMLYC
jgi:hypothetical protein